MKEKHDSPKSPFQKLLWRYIWAVLNGICAIAFVVYAERSSYATEFADYELDLLIDAFKIGIPFGLLFGCVVLCAGELPFWLSRHVGGTKAVLTGLVLGIAIGAGAWVAYTAMVFAVPTFWRIESFDLALKWFGIDFINTLSRDITPILVYGLGGVGLALASLPVGINRKNWVVIIFQCAFVIWLSVAASSFLFPPIDLSGFPGGNGFYAPAPLYIYNGRDWLPNLPISIVFSLILTCGAYMPYLQNLFSRHSKQKRGAVM